MPREIRFIPSFRAVSAQSGVTVPGLASIVNSDRHEKSKYRFNPFIIPDSRSGGNREGVPPPI